MNCDVAKRLLAANGQEHLLRFWPKLSAAGRKNLLSQIAELDFKAIARMQSILAASGASADSGGRPVAPRVTELRGRERDRAVAAGEKLLAAGKVGVILVAGGQGSRLGFDGPKGAYGIGPVSGAPLFYFHARKIVALNRRFSVRIPFYVMTSEANDAATRKCFADNGCWGLDAKDVFFFRQGTWPALDDAGKIILDAPDRIFRSPDGHGGMLAALAKGGAFADMRRRGVTTLFYFQVDNPLVEIADPAFIGFHALSKAQYSLKLCAKERPDENLGMVVKRGGVWSMIEYSEMTEEMNNRRRASGELYFKYGSPAIHVFDRGFLEAESARPMPLHLAHKKIPTLDADGRTVKPDAPNGWKFEKFIFDCLLDAKRVACLAFDRELEFAPVKNASGADSPDTCRAALRRKWRRQLAAAGVTLADPIAVEIDPAADLPGSLAEGILILGR